MIKNVSFSGEVFQAGSVKHLSKPKEIKSIQNYANKKDCDVVILSRDYYAGNDGLYNTILVKTDKTTGQNMFAEETFDFVKNPRSGVTENNPEYMHQLRDLYV